MNTGNFINNRNLLTLFLFVTSIFSAAAVDRSDYETALEKYKNQKYSEALTFFERFIADYPQSVKYDDALWYMGRIYQKTDNYTDAEAMFRKVLSLKGSNRIDEASYDLSKILYSQNKYDEVIQLLTYTESVGNPGTYQTRSLELFARAWNRKAYDEKSAYNNKMAHDLFNKSLSIYENLEKILSDPKDISRIKYAEARIYAHLEDLTTDRSVLNQYRNKSESLLEASIPGLSDFYKPKAEQMLSNIKQSQKVNISGSLQGYLGGNNLVQGNLGADVKAKGSVSIPLQGRNSLDVTAGFRHNSFDFVASNFDPAQTGNAQLMQYSETANADLAWKTGTRRFTFNDLKLFSQFQFAQDNRDNYLSTGLKESGSYRFDPSWRVGWKSQFEWRTYPNYLIAGRKLDYLEGSLKPEIKFYPIDWLTISLIYGIDYKQYLDSKYDTSDPLTASTVDKSYLYNSGKLVLDFQPGKVYNPVLSYNLTYQKTFNYNYWVSGLPTDRYIEGYYDNISQTISLNNKFKFSNRFNVGLKSDLVLTNFLNYPARDSSKTFIDQLRSDISINLNLDAGYVFLITRGGAEFSALLSGWWNYKTSNMTYNTTFTTNYSNWGIMAGASVKLP